MHRPKKNTINPFQSFCPPSCSEVIRDDFSRSLPLETCTRLKDVWQKCLQQKSSGSPNTHTHKQKSCAKFFPVTLLNFYGAFSRVELHLGDQKVGKKAGQLFSCFPSEKLQEENRSIFRQKRSWPNTLQKFTRPVCLMFENFELLSSSCNSLDGNEKGNMFSPPWKFLEKPKKLIDRSSLKGHFLLHHAMFSLTAVFLGQNVVENHMVFEGMHGSFNV